MANIKCYQEFSEIVINDINKAGLQLRESVHAAKKYENDNVHVHQVVLLDNQINNGNGRKFLVIYNVESNQDNPGKLLR
ncbi:hypothetical protein EPH95_06735 [Salicibibacter halophilus]|uniref:Uncharacterized protein n=1 Tax=Salicibibacter halophilus TaxID=2502791 RepID=A0A514LI00_9BACI|nr:hypothetical protein [Salicibibacter halophilus]QDI90911.1 hypothetical protein EPH95_06735 [Salicibibacter halophilus]